MKALLGQNRFVAAISVGALLFLLAILPAFTRESYILHVAILCMLYASLVTAWNLIAGYSGIFIFGFQALFGLGGYVSALTSMKMGISPWLGILIGAVAAMFVGALVAIPSLKLRQMPYIAISTMCLGEVIRLIAANLTSLTRGELGLWGIPAFPPAGPLVFTTGSRVSHYFLILMIFSAILGIAILIVNAPMGMAMKALKDSQDAAESLGINVPAAKIRIFMVSSFLAGAVGSFYAHYMLILTPTAVLGPQFMTELVAMGLIGGLGTIAGPVLGAFLLTTLMEILRLLGNYRLIIYGLLIVVTVIFLRNGIWGTLKPRVTRRWSKWFGSTVETTGSPTREQPLIRKKRHIGN